MYFKSYYPFQFTKFSRVQDIPREFIAKHVRLHGHVRWVGGAPPTPAAASHAHAVSSPAENGARPPPFSSATETEGAAAAGGGGRSLSRDNRGIYEGAGELHPWEDGIDPALARITYLQDVAPLFLQVLSCSGVRGRVTCLMLTALYWCFPTLVFIILISIILRPLT